jgi:hypothetical protein
LPAEKEKKRQDLDGKLADLIAIIIIITTTTIAGVVLIIKLR